MDKSVKLFWLNEFERLLKAKITDYIVSMMCARRSEHTEKIAESVLSHFCDITGEQCHLGDPKNNMQRLQVFMAERFAVWLANLLVKADKVMCEEIEKKSEEIAKRPSLDTQTPSEIEMQEEKEHEDQEKMQVEDETRKEEEHEKQSLEEEEKLEKEMLEEEEELANQKLKEEEELEKQRLKEQEELERQEEEDRQKKLEEEKSMDKTISGENEEEQETKTVDEEIKGEEKEKAGVEEKSVEEEKPGEDEKEKGEEQEEVEDSTKVVEEEKTDEIEKPDEKEKSVEEEIVADEEKEVGEKIDEEDRTEGETDIKEEEIAGEEEIIGEAEKGDEEGIDKPIWAETDEFDAVFEEEEEEEEDRLEMEKSGELEDVHEGLEEEHIEEDVKSEEPTEPLSVIEEWIEETEPVESDKQEAISELLEKEVKESLGDVTPQEEEAIKEVIKKTSTLVDQLTTEAKEQLEAQQIELLPSPPSPLPTQGPTTYLIKKDTERCFLKVQQVEQKKVRDLTKVTRTRKVGLLPESICKRPKNEKPIKKHTEIKDWAKWAADVVNFAEKWSTWISNTSEETKKRIENADDKDNWHKFKNKAERDAIELRRNKKYVSQTSKAWKEKLTKVN